MSWRSGRREAGMAVRCVLARRGLAESEGKGLGGGQGGAVVVFGFESVATDGGAGGGQQGLVFAAEGGQEFGAAGVVAGGSGAEEVGGEGVVVSRAGHQGQAEEAVCGHERVGDALELAQRLPEQPRRGLGVPAPELELSDE